MFRTTLAFVIAFSVCTLTHAQAMLLSTSSSDYEIDNVFSEVEFFSISVEIDAPLAPGVYTNPEIISVDYRITGVLVPGRPSELPSFDLQRSITGAEFYAQGSSLSFEIAESAVLSDGVQAAELVGSALILSFNAREVDTGRFHPPLLELSPLGTGRIQNSNNVPTLDPRVEVDFGEEYIANLFFDTGNTTLITETLTATVSLSDSGGGAMSPLSIAVLIVLGIYAAARRR
ncbi:MAG: hypothetical protein ACR2P1_14360 [Pseudomonadales bacterium]